MMKRQSVVFLNTDALGFLETRIGDNISNHHEVSILVNVSKDILKKETFIVTLNS
jgi:hypothetical protein